jgi:hypothetical protein
MDQNFLLPDESPQDFAALTATWTKAFPGTDPCTETLREDLICADWLLRRARLILKEITLDLYFTGLPRFHWEPIVKRHYRFLEKHTAHTQNEFRKALKLITTTCRAGCQPAADGQSASSHPRSHPNQKIFPPPNQTLTALPASP